MYCAALCLALGLFCVSALAADLEIKVSPVDANAVKVEQKAGSADPIFTVTQTSGAQSGQLYLVMIQQGSDASANPLPTKENLYYLNVEEATGASFSAEAYPRDLAEGSYIVYLSDYSGSNAGKARGVATITVSAKSGGDTPGEGGGSGGDVMKGDLDNDKKRTVDDVMMLIKVVVNNEDPTNLLKIADFDNDTKLTVDDVMILIRMVVNNE